MPSLTHWISELKARALPRLRESLGPGPDATSVAIFVGGFLFDTVTLDRADSLFQILQQSVYLVVIAAMVVLRFCEENGYLLPAGWFSRAITRWDRFREPATHFLLGSLLSSFALFYFKSASLAVSAIYLLVLVFLLLLNEFGRFGKSRTPLHTALLALCLCSFWVYIIPTILGFIGSIPFLISLGTTTASAYPAYLWARKRVPEQGHRAIVVPFFTVVSVFAALYFLRVLPPVPLALMELGIYHKVERLDGAYRLSYDRPAWRFWESGAQTFVARPGEPVYAFARVFSPTRFREELLLVWELKDSKGDWIRQDSIPLEIIGGRDEGYRGFAYKSRYQAGRWRVRILTRDEREVGRIGLQISVGEPPPFGEDSREFRQVIR